MSNDLPGQCEEFPEEHLDGPGSPIIHLSPHFTLQELIRSETAARFRIDNTPPKEVVDNLRELCGRLLEPLRQIVGQPIRINSGYRCPELNTRVRGVKNSQHIIGEAVDIECPAIGNHSLYYLIKRSLLVFDQCLYEYGDEKDWTKGWIHLSFSQWKKNRREMRIVG